jgi:hypothetical protein
MEGCEFFRVNWDPRSIWPKDFSFGISLSDEWIEHSIAARLKWLFSISSFQYLEISHVIAWDPLSFGHERELVSLTLFFLLPPYCTVSLKSFGSSLPICGAFHIVYPAMSFGIGKTVLDRSLLPWGGRSCWTVGFPDRLSVVVLSLSVPSSNVVCSRR